MPLADRDIFSAICSKFTDQSIEFIMEQYEKAKKMNMEIEKRLDGESAVDSFPAPASEPAPVSDTAPAEVEAPRKKRITKRSLVMAPEDSITDTEIICCLCGAKRQSLTGRHLAKHGITVEEYKKLCCFDPKQALMSRQRLAKSHEIIGRAQKARLSKKASDDE